MWQSRASVQISRRHNAELQRETDVHPEMHSTSTEILGHERLERFIHFLFQQGRLGLITSSCSLIKTRHEEHHRIKASSFSESITPPAHYN